MKPVLEAWAEEMRRKHRKRNKVLTWAELLRCGDRAYQLSHRIIPGFDVRCRNTVLEITVPGYYAYWLHVPYCVKPSVIVDELDLLERSLNIQRISPALQSAIEKARRADPGYRAYRDDWATWYWRSREQLQLNKEMQWIRQGKKTLKELRALLSQPDSLPGVSQ